MILTKEYSRVAASFMDAGEAMELLGIQGTGSFEGDRKLVLDLAKKYHSDLNTDKEAERKMIAVNSLRSQFILEKKQLPSRSVPRSGPSHVRKPSRTQERSPLWEWVIRPKVEEGYDLVEKVDKYCLYWLSSHSDRISVMRGLLGGVDYTGKRLHNDLCTRSNQSAYPDLADFIDKFADWWQSVDLLLDYCISGQEDEDQLRQRISRVRHSSQNITWLRGL